MYTNVAIACVVLFSPAVAVMQKLDGHEKY